MEAEANSNSNPAKSRFYAEAAKYWDRVPPTVDGMLGGFGFVSQTDIKGSTSFLRGLFELQEPPSKTYALDCGAGIGRITKNLLSKRFKRVDLVEQNPKFLEAAKDYLRIYSARIGNYYSAGLQNFSPTAGKYDVIWCQWVLGHLEDKDLLRFFEKCSLGLRPNGLLVLKENVTRSDTVEVDTVDSSVTRPVSALRQAFKDANLVCVREERQHDFPHGLYPVHMFALRPLLAPRDERR